MEHGVPGIMPFYFWKSVENERFIAIFRSEVGPGLLPLCQMWTFSLWPPLKSHQSILSLIQAYYLIIFIPIVRPESIIMIGGLVFFMAGQKCHIDKIPFSESEAKMPSGTFRKSKFFFHPFNPFYSAFLFEIWLLFDAYFFQTHTTSGKHVQGIIEFATLDIF